LLILSFVCPILASAAEPVTIAIGGVEGAVLDNLRAAIRLPPGLVDSDGKIDEGLLEQFQKNIPGEAEEALAPFGYYSPSVSVQVRKKIPDQVEEIPAPLGYYSPSVNAQSRKPDGGTVVHVRIDPGNPVHVNSVRVRVEGPGAKEVGLQELADSFPLKAGDILLSDIYESAKAGLQTKARNLGYLDADFTSHMINVHRLDAIADIELTLATGERYYFGETVFSGAPKYPDAFLRRYVSYKKGEPFSYLKLGQTQTSLYNSDRFREVSPQANKETAVEQEVPVGFTLDPRPDKRVKIGPGYGTDTGARLLLRYQDVNVLDTGHEFRSELNISEVLLGITGAYIVPTGNSFRDLTSLRLSLIRENTVSYDSNLLALELGRERPFGPNAQGTAFVQLLTERFSVGTEQSRSFLVLPGVRLLGQKLDSLVRPRIGYRYSLEARGTDIYLGSSTSLFQVVPSADLLLPLPARFSLLFRSQGGITFQRRSFDEIPVSLRFFAGGDRSVRGYAYQSLGPKDASGDVVGGKHLLFGSLELERAIWQDWGIAGFYDAGNAFDSFTDITFAQSAGVGIRYYSRIGPFRLDIARQLDRPNPATRVHFVIGIFL